MALRQWYTKLEYKAAHVEITHLNGKLTPADKLTKPSVYSGHVEFATNVQGLNLLPYDYFQHLQQTNDIADNLDS
jgi:hypothetical protein